MSGGSYDYAYRDVERFAEALERGERFDGEPAYDTRTPARLRFAGHLRKVAAAMRAIEWEDSGDGADEEGAIAAVMGEGSGE